ncbi:hypothetical protein DFH08DRAFT_957556 [Mycena albidolilacea]|uniref:Uncharacterized protein n=1 Tax=Mycena albidolilacea TaxID=1033008 RepID=A0AAD7A834_9AGAR|nr:hypothetical protein DFH08DRAFT_957556 [Mycena albidolilacea]
MLQDTTPGPEFILGDSLDIAGYLASLPVDSTRHGLNYSSPHIHDAAGIAPLSTREATALDLADATFSAYVGLTAQNMACAFPPASTARTKALFAQRMGAPAWDDRIGAFADAEKRARIFRAFDTRIAGLTRLYAQKEWPFLERQTPSYADLVFLEQEEWAEFCT